MKLLFDPEQHQLVMLQGHSVPRFALDPHPCMEHIVIYIRIIRVIRIVLKMYYSFESVINVIYTETHCIFHAYLPCLCFGGG